MSKVRTAAVVAAGGATAVALVAAGKAIAAARAAASDGPAKNRLTKVADFPHQVTGVSVSADGRRFVCFPRWNEDVPVSVAELLPDGRLKAYPDEDWNAWRNAKAAAMSVTKHFVCVQSVVADAHGALWVVDAAAPGNERTLTGGPKLVRIDLATDRVTQVILFGEDVVLQGSYLNDLRVSPDGRAGYLTDSGARGAIVVVDLANGSAFRALDGHPSTQPDPEVTVTFDGRPLLRPDGRGMQAAADGLALSNSGHTLYFQALTGRTLYAIATDKLTRTTTSPEASAAVRAVGRTDVADGLWIARDDTLYVTSPGDNAVKRWNGHALETVVQDARLRWPDTLAEGPDGTLYVTASHIPDSRWFKPGAPAALATALFSFRPS